MKKVRKSLVNLYMSSSPLPKVMYDDYNDLHFDACLPFNFALSLFQLIVFSALFRISYPRFIALCLPCLLKIRFDCQMPTQEPAAKASPGHSAKRLDMAHAMDTMAGHVLFC